MNNYKITFNIGFNDEDTKTQLKGLIVLQVLKSGFDGLTMIDTFEVYQHDDGVRVRKSGVQIQVQMFDVTEEEATQKAIEFCNTIGGASMLNQESIIYEVSELKSVLHFVNH